MNNAEWGRGWAKGCPLTHPELKTEEGSKGPKRAENVMFSCLVSCFPVSEGKCQPYLLHQGHSGKVKVNVDMPRHWEISLACLSLDSLAPIPPQPLIKAQHHFTFKWNRGPLINPGAEWGVSCENRQGPERESRDLLDPERAQSSVYQCGQVTRNDIKGFL